METYNVKRYIKGILFLFIVLLQFYIYADSKIIDKEINLYLSFVPSLVGDKIYYFNKKMELISFDIKNKEEKLLGRIILTKNVNEYYVKNRFLIKNKIYFYNDFDGNFYIISNSNSKIESVHLASIKDAFKNKEIFYTFQNGRKYIYSYDYLQKEFSIAGLGEDNKLVFFKNYNDFSRYCFPITNKGELFLVTPEKLLNLNPLTGEILKEIKIDPQYKYLGIYDKFIIFNKESKIILYDSTSNTEYYKKEYEFLKNDNFFQIFNNYMIIYKHNQKLFTIKENQSCLNLDYTKSSIGIIELKSGNLIFQRKGFKSLKSCLTSFLIRIENKNNESINCGFIPSEYFFMISNENYICMFKQNRLIVYNY